jgi:fibroblast activation protein alpha
LHYAEWVADGEQSGIIFCYRNNIYLVKDVTDTDNIIQLTHDGSVDEIYNGIPDWVYEEEVLNTNKALHISSDGKFLAYAQFNDSLVKFFPFLWFPQII